MATSTSTSSTARRCPAAASRVTRAASSTTITGTGRLRTSPRRRAAGITVPDPGRALGVVWSDLDNDGDLDLYVANDQTPNFLFRNNGNGTFTEVGRASGVAVNGNGRAQAGMGVDAGDWNHTGS